MDDTTQWQQESERYLGLAIAWLRRRLQWQIARVTGEPAETVAEAMAQVQTAFSEMNEAANGDPPPTFILLSQNLGLTRFESDVLLLCLAMELDTRIPALCALAQDDPSAIEPTFALAMALFDNPVWDVLFMDRPLRFWRLIKVDLNSGRPLTTTPLKIDRRIVNYIKHLNQPEEQLLPILDLMAKSGDPGDLPSSQRALVDSITGRLRGSAEGERLPVVQLLGPDQFSKRLCARHVATELGLQLYYLPAELIPNTVPELESLARLWHRESNLATVALYVDVPDQPESAGPEAINSRLNRFLARSDGLFFLDTRDVHGGLNLATMTVQVAKPTRSEQQMSWSQYLGPAAAELPQLLAGQFNLNLASIQSIARQAQEEAQDGHRELPGLLWDACLAHTRPRLDQLAQRLIPKATWEDIVLPPNQSKLLGQIADQVRERTTVYESWGFRGKMNRGLGIVTLFAGDSGTGKTMAAEVLANDLKLNLYRIDLSGVISKYIGETEKNLRKLFDAGEDGGAILFFDEADALFGKRSQVRDSHDRYANIEVNYLLQRMESYQGLAILSSNRKKDLDQAFIRRLRFIVDFPIPGPEDRKRIWQLVFPPQTPLAEMDYERLSGYKLAGGSIHNAALNAAFLAAKAGTAVTMPQLLTAVRSEFLKMDRLINEDDYLWEEES